MKMTKEQVADLLLRMNEDCSNVECDKGSEHHKDSWAYSLEIILDNIINGGIYRIKDNAVKEVTPALRGRWATQKLTGDDYGINAISYKMQKIRICGEWHNLDEFNTLFKLVENKI